MAGIVGLTELQHTNGNSMLTVAITGDGNVKSEGGAVTTSLRQGLAKVWSCVEQGTTALDDSFNCSGITDVATGRFTPAFSNNMNNALYSLTGCCDANGAVAVYGSKTSSSIQLQTGDALGSSGLADYDNASSAINGDLA